MLPRLDHPCKLGFSLVFILTTLSLFLFQGLKLSQATNGNSPEILEPSHTQTISGFQNIKIYDPAAETVDIYLSIGFGTIENPLCYTISKDLTFDENGFVNYSWDSTTVVDSNNYVLWLFTRYGVDHTVGGNSLILKEV